jgi:hypothetical protein
MKTAVFYFGELDIGGMVREGAKEHASLGEMD